MRVRSLIVAIVVMLAGLVLASQRLKIRMIGLDGPETVDPRKPVQCVSV
jgi:hypothetical protein